MDECSKWTWDLKVKNVWFLGDILLQVLWNSSLRQCDFHNDMLPLHCYKHPKANAAFKKTNHCQRQISQRSQSPPRLSKRGAYMCSRWAATNWRRWRKAQTRRREPRHSAGIARAEKWRREAPFGGWQERKNAILGNNGGLFILLQRSRAFLNEKKYLLLTGGDSVRGN